MCTFQKLAGIKYTHQECFDIEAVKQDGSTVGLDVNRFISFLQFLVGHDENTQAIWNILHSSDVTTGYTVEDRDIMYVVWIGASNNCLCCIHCMYSIFHISHFFHFSLSCVVFCCFRLLMANVVCY